MNNRLANVGWTWAFTAATNCEPARQHYRQRREHGDRHAAATRNLFNKLLGQLYYCLQHHQTFDEAKAFPMPLCGAAGRSDSTPSRARDVAAEHEQLIRRREAL